MGDKGKVRLPVVPLAAAPGVTSTAGNERTVQSGPAARHVAWTPTNETGYKLPPLPPHIATHTTPTLFTLVEGVAAESLCKREFQSRQKAQLKRSEGRGEVTKAVGSQSILRTAWLKTHVSVTVGMSCHKSLDDVEVGARAHREVSFALTVVGDLVLASTLRQGQAISASHE